MGKIRVNDLARELEVKSTILLIYLSQLGITVRSHSHPISDETAQKVRLHFRALDEELLPTPPREMGEVTFCAALPTAREITPEPKNALRSVLDKLPDEGGSHRAWAQVLGDARREIMFLLDRIDAPRRRGEGLSDRIRRLSFEEGKLPLHTAGLMRAIVAFRNGAEYEAYCPTPIEARAMRSICDAIDEYAAKLLRNKS